MNAIEVMDTLKAILTELGIPEELIQPNTLLHQELQLDSTETVEVALRLKRRLGVNVKLETRQDLTLAQVCNLIETAMLANSPSEKTNI
jgi:acyl carrier protein